MHKKHCRRDEQILPVSVRHPVSLAVCRQKSDFGGVFVSVCQAQARDESWPSPGSTQLFMPEANYDMGG